MTGRRRRGAGSHGELAATSAPFQQSIIGIFRVPYRQIMSWRDCLTPLALIAASIRSPPSQTVADLEATGHDDAR